MDNESIKINKLKYPRVQKCGSCGRVRDIYYNVTMLDVNNPDLVVGSFEFCQECGNNFNRALGSNLDADQKVIKEFNFEM